MKSQILNIYNLLLILLYSSLCFGQNKNFTLEFKPKFGAIDLKLNENYNLNGQQISFSVLKWYVANLKFLKESKVIYEVKDSYFLMDLSKSNSLCRNFNMSEKIEFDTIQYELGIDEKTNDNGIGENDLDPSNDMYWTWNTGYINFKIEGKTSASSKKDQSFQFHLGGFLAPNISTQTITQKVNSNSSKFVFNLDFEKLLNKIDFLKSNTIMSPSKKSTEMMQQISKNIIYVENK